jgi:hypothetical protein
VQHFVEALFMVGVDLVQALLQVLRLELVRRQHVLNIEVLQLLDRSDVVAERAAVRLGMNGNVGRDRG